MAGRQTGLLVCRWPRCENWLVAAVAAGVLGQVMSGTKVQNIV